MRTVRRCARDRRSAAGSGCGSRLTPWLAVHHVMSAVETELGAQQFLPLRHPLAHGLAELADHDTEAAQRIGQRRLHPRRRELLRGLGRLAHDEDADRRAERDVEQPPRHRRLLAFISDLIRFSISPCCFLLAARRTPYEKAATFTIGLPNVAANSEVSAETLPVIDCTLAVIASTRTSSSLTCVTVPVTSPSSGTVLSVMPATSFWVSVSTLPSLMSTRPRKSTSTTKAIAKMR